MSGIASSVSSLPFINWSWLLSSKKLFLGDTYGWSFFTVELPHLSSELFRCMIVLVGCGWSSGMLLQASEFKSLVISGTGSGVLPPFERKSTLFWRDDGGLSPRLPILCCELISSFELFSSLFSGRFTSGEHSWTLLLPIANRLATCVVLPFLVRWRISPVAPTRDAEFG